MSITAPDLGVAYYAFEWAIRIGALIVVPQRRKPAAAMGWLLFIFFLPLPGLLLFLAIGRPSFPAWRTKRFHALMPYFQRVAVRLKADAPVNLGSDGPLSALADRLGHLPATGGNSVELIDDYDGVISRLIADIDAARHDVSLLVYIFADGPTAQRVIAALREAVARGVTCRVMLDPVGSWQWLPGAANALRAAGVQTHEALPFHLWRGRTRRDMRNHRKLFVIDGRIGYVGSQNIVAKDFRPGVVNRELVARITGPTVAAMVAVIQGDWFLETEADPGDVPAVPAPVSNAVLQLLPSGADYPLEGFQTLLVWMLHQAVDHAILVTPYFIPDESILGAMRTAAARGVVVDVVVSAVVDQRLVNLAQSSYYADLLAAGVRIHLFRDFLLHAKNISIDGRVAIIGSSNVDLRSFQLNEEVSLLLLDDGSVAQVEAIQQGYLRESDRLDAASWRQRSHLRKIVENIARLLSPLL
jgi:cardiolipin synthase